MLGFYLYILNMMTVLFLAGLIIIVIFSFGFVLHNSKEERERKAYRVTIPTSDDNGEIRIDEDGENSASNPFLRKSSEDIWEGRYLPFLIEDLNEKLKSELREQIKQIPPLPSVANHLIFALNDARVSTGQISEIVSSDPVLAGKLLELVNSSFYGLSKEVDSVGRAIILLGFNTVKDLVLQSNLTRILPPINNDLFSIEDFWMHSLVASSCAYSISSGIDGVNAGNVSTIALLHDIGKLGIALWKPSDFKKYIEELKEEHGALPIMIEEKILGLHHALVGNLITENWNLPRGISDAILYHHHPVFIGSEGIPAEHRRAVSIIHFANVISKLCGFCADNDVVTGTREEYFLLIDRGPPLESLLGRKALSEITRIKSFMKSPGGSI